MDPTSRCGPARAEPRLPETNPELFKLGSFPLYLAHHIFNPGKKLSNGPRKWREFAQREAASEACLCPEQNLPGSWGQEGMARQEPLQDEVLHSLGLERAPRGFHRLSYVLIQLLNSTEHFLSFLKIKNCHKHDSSSQSTSNTFLPASALILLMRKLTWPR